MAMILSYKLFDINQINRLLETGQSEIKNLNIFALLLIFTLRFISIIIPAIPGTYCSVIAGYLFGIEAGMIIIFLADFSSCSSSFFLSRRLGKSFVEKFLGNRQMKRIEKIGKQYIEHNFFLMTAFLMTQFFDFVCYAIGLTKISWRKFMPALIISILISDAPFVAGGFTIKELGSASFGEVLKGDVSALQGPYLSIFILSILTIFILGVLNLLVTKRSRDI